MFEREITDAMFVRRWSIVRTLMPQSIAEHTFAVAHYANDLACYMEFADTLHLRLLQYALWHDAKDEIFTGDLPGPNKRGLLDAIGPDAKERWNAKLAIWAHRVFDKLKTRSGQPVAWDKDTAHTIELALKTADWLEAAVRMATETQMGNRCAERHVIPNRDGARDTARKLCQWVLPVEPSRWKEVDEAIVRCVEQALNGQSTGPWITREDDHRVFDPALGDRG